MENLDKEKIKQHLSALKEQLAAIDAQEKHISVTDFGKQAAGMAAFSNAQKTEAKRMNSLRNQFFRSLEYPDSREEVIASLKFLFSMLEIRETGAYLVINYTSGGVDDAYWCVSYADEDLIFDRAMLFLTKAQKEYVATDEAMRLALIDIVEENKIDDCKRLFMKEGRMGSLSKYAHGYQKGSLSRKGSYGSLDLKSMVTGSIQSAFSNGENGSQDLKSLFSKHKKSIIIAIVALVIFYILLLVVL